MKNRGTVIALREEWLETFRQRTQGASYSQLGRKLAEAIGRTRPYGKSTIGRYMRGELVTQELTEAFCRMLGLPSPVQSLTIEEAKMLQNYRAKAAMPTHTLLASPPPTQALGGNGHRTVSPDI